MRVKLQPQGWEVGAPTISHITLEVFPCINKIKLLYKIKLHPFRRGLRAKNAILKAVLNATLAFYSTNEYHISHITYHIYFYNKSNTINGSKLALIKITCTNKCCVEKPE